MTHKELRRKIELWHTGVSKLPLNEYLGVTVKELNEILTNLKMGE